MKLRPLHTVVLLAALIGCRGPEGAANQAHDVSSSANTQQAPTTPPAGPEGLAFAEYDRACRDLPDVPALNSAATAGGWQVYEPEAGSHAARLLAFANEQARPHLNGGRFDNWTYRKTVDGRQLVLIVTDIAAGPAQSTECRVYDFDAAAPPSEAAVALWTPKPPTQRIAEQGLTLYQWTPGFRDGLSQQSVIHMAPDSPLRQEIPAVGLAITATRGAASRE